MLKNLSIKTKMIIGLTMVLLNTTIVGIVGYNGISGAKLIAVLIFMVFISMAIGIVILQSITQSIIHLKNVVEQAEKGNLTVRGKVNSKDELGKLTNSFNRFLGKVQENLRNTCETSILLNKSSEGLLQVADAMTIISKETSLKTNIANAAIEEITSGTVQTASALTDTSKNMTVIASSVEEMTGTIRNLATVSEETSLGVQQANKLVSHISGSINNVSVSAKDVSYSVNSVVTAIREINISLNEISKNCERSIKITSGASGKAKDTNEIIEHLNESSKQIGKIVGVINDIADQTNMLALNAAIEAAGAGEAKKEGKKEAETPSAKSEEQAMEGLSSLFG